MQRFTVEGMTCAHCKRAVSEAIKRLDPDAQVRVDLGSGLVEADGRLDAAEVRKAIEEEGYRVVSG
ncbi:heavy-metal-associated domain-containing protein [Stutzerimonas azotifigens]|uniref:Heavy-metal-associated domain-containing protein n=1 Tax=Stutzerimonas azotifigens TaxID=291995 RepID=A0ABR5Z5S6_9GAMM|nr:heavy-metal-associated domain-containing protein [Stutzerimonas azotifigens]MBA1275482.1 heavy-metal-associated domain-containing protein [Stutzerimonas azotifigens]